MARPSPGCHRSENPVVGTRMPLTWISWGLVWVIFRSYLICRGVGFRVGFLGEGLGCGVWFEGGEVGGF